MKTFLFVIGFMFAVSIANSQQVNRQPVQQPIQGRGNVQQMHKSPPNGNCNHHQGTGLNQHHNGNGNTVNRPKKTKQMSQTRCDAKMYRNRDMLRKPN